MKLEKGQRYLYISPFRPTTPVLYTITRVGRATVDYESRPNSGRGPVSRAVNMRREIIETLLSKHATRVEDD